MTEMQKILLNSSNVRNVVRVDDEGEMSGDICYCSKSQKNIGRCGMESRMSKTRGNRKTYEAKPE